MNQTESPLPIQWPVTVPSSLSPTTSPPKTPSRESVPAWPGALCTTLLLLSYLLPASGLTDLLRKSAVDFDMLVGYTLIIFGYLLLPGVGIVLMKRKRAVARTRAAVLSGHGHADSSIDTCALGLAWRPASVAHRVDRHTVCLPWVDEPVQCAVCLSDLERHCEARRLPCGHAFHKTCADLWLVTGGNNSCPLCMAPVCDEPVALKPAR